MTPLELLLTLALRGRWNVDIVSHHTKTGYKTLVGFSVRTKDDTFRNDILTSCKAELGVELERAGDLLRTRARPTVQKLHWALTSYKKYETGAYNAVGAVLKMMKKKEHLTMKGMQRIFDIHQETWGEKEGEGHTGEDGD